MYTLKCYSEIFYLIYGYTIVGSKNNNDVDLQSELDLLSHFFLSFIVNYYERWIRDLERWENIYNISDFLPLVFNSL